MKIRDFAERICSPDFLTEIHLLLWTNPKDRNGEMDFGWNCRDHAVVVGPLSQMFKFSASVFDGKSIYVQGPSGGNPPNGIGQSIHAWTVIERGGHFDLSLKFPPRKYYYVRHARLGIICNRDEQSDPEGCWEI